MKKMEFLKSRFVCTCKDGSEEERLYKTTSIYSKFEFSVTVTLCLTFKELFFTVFQ